MASSTGNAGDEDFLFDVFPDDFGWGVATAAYQIEGAPEADGKGKSIWDTFSHTEGKIIDGNNGDTACESYTHFQRDIEMLKELGVSHYRLSLSWTRILPSGTLSPTSPANAAGIVYYNKVIDALLAAGIQPMVTLYHWDLPQPLQDSEGWLDRDLADKFEDYARVCFESFGDRVKLWITFNEPLIFTWYGYGSGEDAPGHRRPAKMPFRAGHTVVRAHARVYRMYDTEFRSKQGGKVGISLNTEWPVPLDPSDPSHVEAAEKLRQCKFGWFAGPVFGNGDYPEVLKQQVKKKCLDLGLRTSLPKFSKEEIELNKGSADFVGINHYTTRLCSPATEPIDPHIEGGFFDVKEDVDPKWKRGASSWLYMVPWGLRHLLRWVKKTYNNPTIYITENGFSDTPGTIEDSGRIEYYRGYVNEVLKAVKLDNVDVRGYIAWTLMDNFEWAAGFTERFGLYYIDFNDPEKKRVQKKSAKYYASIIKQNGFPKDDEK